jgi:hypothetical protein
MATARKWWLLLLLLLVPVLAMAFQILVKNKMVDFSVNFLAAERLRAGETLYRVADGHYQFKYMPFSAFLYLPLTLLPLPAAKAVWYSLVIVSSALIFYLSAKLIRPERRKVLPALFLTALVLGRYFLREVQLGQINALITALLLLMVVTLDAGERGVSNRTGAQGGSGVCWGLAAALKPYALIYFPYFLLKKRWLLMAGGLSALGLAVLAPSLFYGPRGNIVVLEEWWSTLSASTPSLLTSQDNVSLMGFLAKWTGRQNVALAAYFFILAALAALVLVLLHRGHGIARPFVLETFILLALIPLVSPLGWDYTLLAAAPAVMLITCHLDKFSPAARGFLYVDFAVIGLSLYDLMGRALYSRFMASSAITLCFMILIGCLCYLRFRRYV